MAAPTLQAEGTNNQVTSGTLTLTLPGHATDDILVCIVLFWLPNTTGSAAVIPDLADWTKQGFVQFPGTPDGEVAFFWRRATSGAETNPTFTRGASWDTGTDGIYAGRAYVIRGAINAGDPWDEFDPTAALTAANGSCDAVTVSGTERMVVQFLGKTDDFVTAPTISGWTAGTQVESITGTDSSFGTFRKDNVSSSTTADASTVEAVAAGAYVFFGVSFKPGIAPVLGTALGAYTFTGTASGIPEVLGTAVAAETFTGTAQGVRGVVGSAAGAYTFAGTASGIVEGGGVQGQAAGAYIFDGTAQGTPGHDGQALGAYTFGATASGVPGVLGQAAANITFGATAQGIRGVLGTALGDYTFTGTASGQVVGSVQGQALGAYIFDGTALGQVGHTGQALGQLGYLGQVAGTVGRAGAALGSYTFAGTALGQSVAPYTPMRSHMDVDLDTVTSLHGGGSTGSTGYESTSGSSGAVS